MGHVCLEGPRPASQCSNPRPHGFWVCGWLKRVWQHQQCLQPAGRRSGAQHDLQQSAWPGTQARAAAPPYMAPRVATKRTVTGTARLDPDSRVPKRSLVACSKDGCGSLHVEIGDRHGTMSHPSCADWHGRQLLACSRDTGG
ncbi:hypothetical protein BDW02DRAFT_136495 [Decorospora gaudefroyi]|uniref:Uncharacterized protein n=1 Tax=Decorospora gaudefroyi TaxID=184978 RepID=A0A6A5JZG8_9PLEO|nr:hypothetical protein BDW02DRAFT_136495 [Decorospora gaudefroyi]